MNKKSITKNNVPNHGYWVETYSGIKFDLVSPDSSMIDLDDIAWSLSRQSRYNGHSILPITYTVADHSLWVADYLYALTSNPIIALHGLMHDAHEAYVGDIVTPVKSLPDIKQTILILEFKVQKAINDALNLSLKYLKEIKKADAMALTTEIKVMMDSAGVDWPNLEPLDITARQIPYPKPRKPEFGYQEFLKCYHKLSAEVQANSQAITA
jgi:hypothetical protein